MDDSWLEQARAHWVHRGAARPEFARTPGPGEESVWDYPRPPAIRPCAQPVRVLSHGQSVAASSAALEVLETSHPPTVYVPAADVELGCLREASGSSFCEWKGAANYFHVIAGGVTVEGGAWSYRSPLPEFERIAGYFCFYPSRFDCFYGEEKVRPQASGFYGGWVRSGLVGPFKGEAGTSRW